MTNDIARFEYSTDEAFYYVLEFVSGLTLTGRSFEVLVKDRASNTVRATLTLGNGLTMVSATEISAAVTRPAMASWPRGEYQADLVDITGGARSRIMAVRFVYDYPGNLVYGVRDRKAFINWGPNRAYVTATGAVGPVGPPGLAATISIGDVETVPPDQPADVRNSGTASAAVLDFDIPAGAAATVAVGDVETVAPGEPADVRNSGTAAAAILDFDIPAGEAATVAVGDVTTIAPGEPADVRNSGTAAAAVFDFDIPAGEKGDLGDQGYAGWSPVLATISDGARRVHQVIDWTGGEGAKPATGGYIGLTGLVPNIADGIDIRGPVGTATIPDGDKGDITTSEDGDTWEISEKVVTFAKLQDVSTNIFVGRKTASSGSVEELTPADARTLLNLVSHGQCRLAKVGANIILSPVNGDKLLVGGAPQTVPHAGVTLSATGLTPGTLYYIYAYMNSGAMTLEASTTSHSTDSMTGVEVKTGDATRTLVGMARPITGPAWQDSAAQRFVVSWFNRRTISSYANFTADRSLSGAPFAEINTEIRNEFLAWGDEGVSSTASGAWVVSGVAVGVARINFDGSVAGIARCNTTASFTVGLSLAEPTTYLAEGYHYATLEGGQTGGTNVIFVGSMNGNVSLMTTLRG